MVKVKKHPDVEYRCILGRHWVAVPVIGWHCGGRLTGRERREERDRQRWWKAGALLSRLLYSAALLFCVVLCCALFSCVVLCCAIQCCAVLFCGVLQTPSRLLCYLVQQCCARLQAGCSPEFHSVAPAPLTWQVVRASLRDHHGRPGLEGHHNREGGGGQQRGGEVERAQHG